ncbi:MAG: helix-turn-helix transcriptional regulator [Clostridia bacterium]|nr:helix-turn-helix transcriptional regulator [Clostridia bacterium]
MYILVYLILVYKYYIRRNLLGQAFSEDNFYNKYMRIGDRIKELRKEKEYSQADLAKLVGVSQKAVDYWERSVNEPKSSYIIALVKTFEITYDEFFTDVE